MDILKAPVVTNGVAVTDIGTEPALVHAGSGTATVFFQSSSDGDRVGILFGSTPSGWGADPTYCFPVPYEGIEWKIGPSSKYFSVVCLDGGFSGSLIYYVEGETALST